MLGLYKLILGVLQCLHVFWGCIHQVIYGYWFICSTWNTWQFDHLIGVQYFSSPFEYVHLLSFADKKHLYQFLQCLFLSCLPGVLIREKSTWRNNRRKNNICKSFSLESWWKKQLPWKELVINLLCTLIFVGWSFLALLYFYQYIFLLSNIW
jgi:hypothetical protein